MIMEIKSCYFNFFERDIKVIFISPTPLLDHLTLFFLHGATFMFNNIRKEKERRKEWLNERTRRELQQKR